MWAAFEFIIYIVDGQGLLGRQSPLNWKTESLKLEGRFLKIGKAESLKLEEEVLKIGRQIP
jgi:hypothetical protein